MERLIVLIGEEAIWKLHDHYSRRANKRIVKVWVPSVGSNRVRSSVLARIVGSEAAETLQAEFGGQSLRLFWLDRWPEHCEFRRRVEMATELAAKKLPLREVARATGLPLSTLARYCEGRSAAEVEQARRKRWTRIYVLHLLGMTRQEIAAELGVAKEQVSRAVAYGHREYAPPVSEEMLGVRDLQCTADQESRKIGVWKN
jgi:hypothetical protein